jgi:hypothetical protein
MFADPLKQPVIVGAIPFAVEKVKAIAEKKKKKERESPARRSSWR